MVIKQLELWLDKFDREIGVKSSIILTGNTSDIMFNPRNNGRYEPVLNSVISAVKEKEFSQIIKWDRVDGIDYEVSNIVDANTVKEREAPANTYNLDSEQTGNVSEEGTSAKPKYQMPDEFFPYLLQVVRESMEKTAIIIDYSDYIFDSSQASSERERHYLATLGKVLTLGNNYNMLDTRFYEGSNIVIIITKSIAKIPTDYYLKNSEVSVINIPTPGRNERERFIETNRSCLRTESKIGSSKLQRDEIIDAFEGFTLKEIAQVMKLSRQLQGDSISAEKLINLYKYGEKISPWEELSREKLEKIEEILKERVKGQDEAISKVKDTIIRAYTGFSGIQHSSKQKKPKGTLFFVGPTGVGKTELAKALAQFIFGDENACIRFDMSEFNHEHSDQRFVGAPPGYVGHESGGQLTNAVKRKPFCVLLFDEVEKAHGRVLDKFLQILEDGRLTDGKGETVYFSETIIIFTSNIGASEVSSTLGKASVQHQFIEKVREHFISTLGRPELLNRIGENIVAFNFIDNEEVFQQIAEVKFKSIEDFLKEKYNAKLVFQDRESAFKAISKKAGIENGGRGLLNTMESTIINPLSNFVFNMYDSIVGRTIIIKPMFEELSDKAIFKFELE